MAINSVQYKKDAKGGKCKLYAFPTFAVSDALLFLPSAMASYINSADHDAFSRLLWSHLDKDCEIKINLLQDKVLNTRRFLKFHDLMTDLHPDSIMCVHSSKFVNNQLCASIYLKFTDSKVIYESVAKTVTDPVLRGMLGAQRASCLLHRSSIRNSHADADVKDEFSAFVAGDADFVVYVRIDMVLTIDETSKKVTCYELKGQVTSMKALDQIDYSSDEWLHHV